MTANSRSGADTVVETVIDSVGSTHFDRWFSEKQFEENISAGKPYLNTPPPVKPPEQHSPSQLHQCHRKIYYRQLNAPEETKSPEGIFWTGTKFEEEIAVPYLKELVRGEAYVRNSMWVNYTLDTGCGELQVRGETDPVIVDEESCPLLLTEIKTKQSVEDLTEPNEHHVAQTYAYLEGLSRKWETDIRDALIIYGSRTSFNIRAFHVCFKEEQWRELVLDWAAAHTEYRLDKQLPPANPEYDWECQFCSFKFRCGQGDSQYKDMDSQGFLPLFDEYPEKKVTEYLDGHNEAKLTPTLAHQYPHLTERYAVYRWRCQRCAERYEDASTSWDGNLEDLPLCPSCASEGIPVPLAEPTPDEQKRVMEE